MASKRTTSWLLLLLSLALYLLCLTLPAFLFDKHAPLLGLDLLKNGWWGLTMGHPGWLGNIMLMLSVVLFLIGRREQAFMAALAACTLGLLSFATLEWWFNEAGPTPIRHFGAGFYVWQLSFVSLLGSCWLGGGLANLLPKRRLD